MNDVSPKVERLAESLLDGARLHFQDAICLFQDCSLLELARLADRVRQKKHPNRIVTYIVSWNINYTNVCWVRCRFCSFYRPPGSDEGYVLPKEEIFRKIREMVDAGGIEILIQGGLNPVEDKAVLMKKLGRKQLTLHLQSPLSVIPPGLAEYPLELSPDGAQLVYTFDTQGDRTGIAGLLRRLSEHAIDFRDLNTSESSLEEIFVNLVRSRA